MTLRDSEPADPADPTDELTKYFMGRYLGDTGYTWSSLATLPDPERERLLAAATTFASTQLANVPNKAALLRMIQSG